MTAASCDAAITAARTISGSASLHPAMTGPGQVKADERHALEAAPAGGDGAIAVIVAAPAPVGTRERSRQMGERSR